MQVAVLCHLATQQLRQLRHDYNAFWRLNPVRVERAQECARERWQSVSARVHNVRACVSARACDCLREALGQRPHPRSLVAESSAPGAWHDELRASPEAFARPQTPEQELRWKIRLRPPKTHSPEKACALAIALAPAVFLRALSASLRVPHPP